MSISEQIYIGVDGGGTGCRALIGTSDRVLGEGRSGPANISSDEFGAIRNVLSAIQQAMIAAGVSDVTNVRAHVGLAGVMNVSHVNAVAEALPFTHVTVTDDRPTTLAGALNGADGIVVAVGTGSFVGAKRHDETRFVGGWGLAVSDEASGAWLGRSGLAAALHAYDGIQDYTEFTQDLIAHFDNDPNTLAAFAATASPADYGRFAPRVIDAAKADDPVAVALMTRGAAYIEMALRSLKFQSGDPVCLTGGVGPAYARFLSQEFTDNLLTANGPALEGALTLARAMP